MQYQKAVLITGSNGSIGEALCKTFRSSRYSVIATDVVSRPNANADLFLEQNLLSVVRDSEVRGAFRKAVTNFLDQTGARLTVLINNAATQVLGSVQDISIEEFEQAHTINVTACLALAQLFSLELRTTTGTIVNIGSIHSRLTKPGFCSYSTSKAALSGLSRAMALDFAGQITVNTIAPAAVNTAMLRAGFAEEPDKLQSLAAHHPAGRICDPQEVAKMALYLASEDARFLTGAELSIDGGIGVRLHDPV